MAASNYEKNFGIQLGLGPDSLVATYPDLTGGTTPADDITFALPTGFTAASGTGVSVTNGIVKLLAGVGGYDGTAITFTTPDGSIQHEVKDSGGGAIEANTANQAAL